MRKFFRYALASLAIAMLAASPAIAGTTQAPLPTWAHWQHARMHHGHRCITVWGGNGDTSALVCDNGTAYTS